MSGIDGPEDVVVLEEPPLVVEADSLRVKLEQCRLELAALREEQETWAEQYQMARRKRAAAEKRLRALTRVVNEFLVERERVEKRRSRRWGRVRVAEDQRDFDAIRASDLFAGPWYVGRYPDVVHSGMSPARHYLEIGAAEGNDPGPKFSTRRYLGAHPEVARSGENPLLHHLRRHGPR
jgi:hypothetical protein